MNELECTDYENRCGNCHGFFEENDKYCRYCGTKRGEGAFAPYQNFMECIYGPAPVKRTHECPKCKYTWETFVMIDDEDYCPQCGARAAVVKESGFCQKLYKEAEDDNMEKSKEPTIMIGIGGTGISAVEVLKKKIKEEMEVHEEHKYGTISRSTK